mmetsp:Transcript_2835/g.2657  ORF Transcript_2835/g.2657 Transcript_2835/m.2657 type:complete len:116 (-) Transcript_2835:192-539(-)
MVDKKVLLKVWDGQGDERFRHFFESLYKLCQGIVLVYDCGCEDSFLSLESWLKMIEANSPGGDLPKVLVANKTDLEEREVDEARGRQYAKDNHMSYFEVCARTGENVDQTFNTLI